jgi:hypothetical protein
MQRYQNIVIGQKNQDLLPHLFARDSEDWKIEKLITIWTDERFLPKIMLQSGLINRLSEIKNRKDLWIDITESGYQEIRFGKRMLAIFNSNMESYPSG